MTSTSKSPPRPVVLCILDGWGLRSERRDNAIALGHLPVWNRFMRECAHARIGTSGKDVGLPDGQMGNSEVGHMNIGAGRIAVPDLPRIDNAILDGSFFANEQLASLLSSIRAAGGTLHVLGLLSPGGVHSHQDHMLALVRAADSAGVPVAVHAFLDGRDTPPRSAAGFVAEFAKGLAAYGRASIATVIGRYWAMDRDKRWERVTLAYDAMVDAAAPAGRFADAATAIDDAYASDETDEFVKPRIIGAFGGMKDGDGLIMANFRADRAREILTALLDPHFDGFKRSRMVRFTAAAGMAEYSVQLNPFLATLYPPVRYAETLGEVVAKAGRTQLRIAETEKYAHVTFFLNGGDETVFPGEERILVPSPKVATYDLKPDMSAAEVTDRLVDAISGGTFDLIVVNYANPDMVGHTGILDAAIKAAETVDTCLGRLEAAVNAAGGVMLITADHGNLEEMRDAVTGEPHTQHTTNLVPAVLVGPAAKGYALKDGRLADLAPTLLQFLGLPQPAEMTGRSLLVSGAAAAGNRVAV